MIGDGLFQITIYHGYLIQILAAELLFTLNLRRRAHFYLRLILGTVVYIALSIVIPNWIAQYVSGIFSLTIFLLSLALCTFCFQAKFRDVVFCCVGAQLTQNLSYNIENLIYQPFAQYIGQNGWLCISLMTTVAVYTICYRLFARRLNHSEDIRLDSRYVYGLSLASALFVYTMQYLFQSFEINKMWITRPPLIFCCIAGLCVQYGLLELKSEQEEKALLERVMLKEQKQYEITRNSMDLINMKAHDLKHQITLMRATGKCDNLELSEIESAVAQYEGSSNTGNRALDVILTEKQRLCRIHSVEMTVMVQGQALAFLQPADIASLFGNILDNAIECECGVEPSTRRCIALTVCAKGNLTCIRAENYCPVRPQMYGGLPLTSKADGNYHGFGLRSVRYITEKYGGTLHIGFEGKLFVVSILLPQPSEDAEI